MTDEAIKLAILSLGVGYGINSEIKKELQGMGFVDLLGRVTQKGYDWYCKNVYNNSKVFFKTTTL